MKRFSERLAFNDTPRMIQTEGMSDPLRNSLWNFVVSMFDEGEYDWHHAASYVAQFFRKVPVDDLPIYNNRCREWIKQYFFALPWYEVYDLMEFISESYPRILRYGKLNTNRIHAVCNRIFEEELSGYRFMAGVLAPISSPAETGEIASAIEITSRTGLDGAHAHIQAALHLLAKRPDPDYRNSVKESISAIESMAKQLAASDSQGLAGALDELAKDMPLHGALRSAFVKLYGYTSDESGIRHAILDEPNVGFDEAKYMVVACSAFVNFLASKAQASGLLKR